MSHTPRPRLSIVRRGKPNFEDPGGATLRGGGNRKFQFYPGGTRPLCTLWRLHSESYLNRVFHPSIDGTQLSGCYWSLIHPFGQKMRHVVCQGALQHSSKDFSKKLIFWHFMFNFAIEKPGLDLLQKGGLRRSRKGLS